jgi:hypothetical protein
MTDSTNGEFKGSTIARLERIEKDIVEIKTTVSALKTQQDRWLGIIGAGAFALPILIRIVFP